MTEGTQMIFGSGEIQVVAMGVCWDMKTKSLYPKNS